MDEGNGEIQRVKEDLELPLFASRPFQVIRPQEFSSFMKRLRTSNHISARNLSAQMGYGPNGVQNWEAKFRNPKLMICRDWADALGYDLFLIVTKKKKGAT